MFNGPNKIFIQSDIVTNLDELNDQSYSIGVSKDIIEVLYKNKSNIDISEFKSKINQFDQIYLEIQYPSIYFDEVFNTIKNTKIKVRLIVSEFRQKEKNIFQNNTNISTIKISDSNVSICESAFKKCISLRQISIPFSLKTISNSAFLGCSSLRKISIPLSVTNIEDYAFTECSSLETIINSTFSYFDRILFI